MAESDNFYDDEFALDEEQFPMQRAEAAAMLADEMRKEEEALSQVGPGIPYAPPAAPVSMPGPTMADLRGQYNLAVRDRDDMAALSAMREMEAARGGDPGRILRVQTQVPYEIPSPAQQQYEAQQAYMRELDMGVPQQTAFAKYAPVMLQGQNAAAMKAFVPPKTLPLQLRNIAGVGYEWDPNTGTVTPRTPARPQKPIVAQGVLNMHRALIAQEIQANQGEDAGAKNKARFAREAFEKEHPEVMGQSATTAAPMQSTVTAPPVWSEPRVRMRSPSGALGSIPRSQVDDAIKAGYKRL